MKRLAVALALLGAGCNGGGGGGLDEITVTASQSSILAGRGPITLTATLDGAPVDVVWTVVGPGYLLYISGTSTEYWPPLDVAAPTEATIVALTEDGRGETVVGLGLRPYGTLDLTILGVDFDPGFPFVGFQENTIVGATSYFGADGSYPLKEAEYAVGPEYLDISTPFAFGDLVAETDYISIVGGQTTPYTVRYVGAGGFIWGSTVTGTVDGFLTLNVGAGTFAPSRTFPSSSAGASVWDQTSMTLWVAGAGTDVVNAYDQAALSESNLAPSYTIVSGMVSNTATIATPSGIAMRNGIVWVGNAANGTIAAFDTGTLPATLVTFIGGDVSHSSIDGVAVDSLDNVWAVSGGNILRFDAGTLGTTATPDLILTGAAPQGSGLTFDLGGSLWVANGTEVRRFDSATLSGSGVVVALPDLTLTSPTISDTEAVTFDIEGNLWVADRDSGISFFSFSILGGTGAVNEPNPAQITTTPHRGIAIGTY